MTEKIQGIRKSFYQIFLLSFYKIKVKSEITSRSKFSLLSYMLMCVLYVHICVCIFCVCTYSVGSVWIWSSFQSYMASRDNAEVAGAVLQHPPGHWRKENNKPLRVYIPWARFESNIIGKKGRQVTLCRDMQRGTYVYFCSAAFW